MRAKEKRSRPWRFGGRPRRLSSISTNVGGRRRKIPNAPPAHQGASFWRTRFAHGRREKETRHG